MLACLIAGTGSEGISDVHLGGTPLRRDPDFLGYRGILMTLRSLTYSGFLHKRTHLWDPFWSLLIDPPNHVYPSSHSTDFELSTQARDLPIVTYR